MSSVLELVGVSHRFDGPVDRSPAEWTLKDVSLEVREGEIVTLLGPSGCGKSTILNLFAGFIMPTAGSARCRGQVITSPSPERGVIFQSYALFPWLNVRDNISFGCRLGGKKPSDYMKRCESIIREVNLNGFEDYYPYQISGGMKQRVQIARTLVNESGVILLDEPFGALDAQTRGDMHVLLLRVCQSHGTTVLFITHDIDEALILSDRIYMMGRQPGRILAEVANTLARPRTTEVLSSREFGMLKQELLGYLAWASEEQRTDD